jgi:hypothetical protein
LCDDVSMSFLKEINYKLMDDAVLYGPCLKTIVIISSENISKSFHSTHLEPSENISVKFHSPVLFLRYTDFGLLQ